MPGREPAPRARVRAVLARRGAQAEREGAVYRVYLVVMTLLVVVAPVLRAAAVSLGDAWPALGPSGPAIAAAAVCGVLAILALLGAQRGPAAASLPEIDLVLTGPAPRARALAPAVLRAFAAAALLGAVVGGVFGIATGPANGWSPAIAVGAGLGLLGAALLLAGQTGRAVRAGLAAVLLLIGIGVGAAAAVLPVGAILALATGLAVLGAATVPIAPFFAARIPLRTLREQAARWMDVTMLALSGDPAIAAARLGASVRVGRGWRWRVPRRAVPAILLRDLRGVLRTPARSALAVLATLGAGILLAPATGGAEVPTAALAGAGIGAALYAALGPLCRGLRAAGEGIGGPALLPLTPGRLVLAHALLPGLFALVMLLLGFGIGLVTVPLVAPPPAAAGGGAVLALAIAVTELRVLSVLKGTLPQRLLAPIPTAAGDLSALNVLAWTFDGPVCAAVVGAMITGLAVGAPQALLAVVIPILIGLGLWARGRYRAVRGI